MDFLYKMFEDWLKKVLIDSIVSNISGLFTFVNDKIAEISFQVGSTPSGWNKDIFNMIRNLSENVILPIAGVILAFVMTLELIQMITDRNNLHDVDTWMFFKWIFKTACAVLIISNTWVIVMGIFDVSQEVVNGATGIILHDTSIGFAESEATLRNTLTAMETGELFGLWLQTAFVGITTQAIGICVFIICYGRMIEIYLITSIAPIPMATAVNKEWGQMGQNYLRSLMALGFQGFLIIVCVAIYAVLIQEIGTSDNISMAIWTSMGYTVLLCFTLFKTGSLSKAVFNAH